MKKFLMHPAFLLTAGAVLGMAYGRKVPAIGGTLQTIASKLPGSGAV